MATTFSSTSFLLQNGQMRIIENSNMRRIELDIVDDNTSREVCRGSNCSLFYDNKSNDYLTMGNCKKEKLCTKINFIKDSIFISKGIQSSTCINKFFKAFKKLEIVIRIVFHRVFLVLEDFLL